LSRLGKIFEDRREVFSEEDFEQELKQMPNKQYVRVENSQREDEEEKDRSPLAIVNEIKENPSQKGTFSTHIGGVPVDLHILEDYLVKTSPFALKTVMRYHNARNMEEIKNYSRGPNVKMNSKMLIMIVICIAFAILGVFMIMFMPKIMAMFQGGI